MNCLGSGEKLGSCRGKGIHITFTCSHCDKEFDQYHEGDTIVPDHVKLCDHDSDDDYCGKCGEPQGSMRNMIVGEIEEQLDRN